MTKPLVSVIIPVYNVEKYLERCVDSVIAQSYKQIEILLVDDGSTDNSGKLCDVLAQKDSRIIVIHKPNGGLSDARNAALNIMKGEKVTFIDSDDWIHKDYIKCMIDIMQHYECQIVSAIYENVTNDDFDYNPVLKNNGFVKSFDNKAGVATLLSQKYFTTAACCKMYESSLWNNLRFPKGKLYEDVETIYKVFASASKSGFCKHILYYYYQRPGSIVRDNFTIQKMDYRDNCKLVIDDVTRRYPDLMTLAISRLVWADIHILVHMDKPSLYVKEHNELWNDVKKYRKKLLLDKECRLKNKLLLLLTYGGDKLLKIIFKITTK